MQVTLSHDAILDVWTLTHADVNMNSLTDVLEWHELLLSEAQKLQGKKVTLFIDITGVVISSGAVGEYGKRAKEFIGTHTTYAIRYGATDGWTESQVRLQSIIHRSRVPMLRDREAAIAALKHIRSQPSDAPI